MDLAIDPPGFASTISNIQKHVPQPEKCLDYGRKGKLLSIENEITTWSDRLVMIASK